MTDKVHMWTLSVIFKMATTGVSKKSGFRIFCSVTSGLQNIQLNTDIQNICGLGADIKIIDTYHIFGQPFCKSLTTRIVASTAGFHARVRGSFPGVKPNLMIRRNLMIFRSRSRSRGISSEVISTVSLIECISCK